MGDDNFDKSSVAGFRANGWAMFSKFTEVLQVFCYQAAVFYAQWTFVFYRNDFKNPDLDGPNGAILTATVPLRDWLCIEFFSFYAYMASAIFFIARYQIKAWYNGYEGNEHMISDIKK